MRRKTQYDVENAMIKINGYFSLETKSDQHEFERAKKELIENLLFDLSVVESINIKAFLARRR